MQDPSEDPVARSTRPPPGVGAAWPPATGARPDGSVRSVPSGGGLAEAFGSQPASFGTFLAASPGVSPPSGHAAPPGAQPARLGGSGTRVGGLVGVAHGAAAISAVGGPSAGFSPVFASMHQMAGPGSAPVPHADFVAGACGAGGLLGGGHFAWPGAASLPPASLPQASGRRLGSGTTVVTPVTDVAAPIAAALRLAESTGDESATLSARGRGAGAAGLGPGASPPGAVAGGPAVGASVASGGGGAASGGAAGGGTAAAAAAAAAAMAAAGAPYDVDGGRAMGAPGGAVPPHLAFAVQPPAPFAPGPPQVHGLAHLPAHTSSYGYAGAMSAHESAVASRAHLGYGYAEGATSGPSGPAPASAPGSGVEGSLGGRGDPGAPGVASFPDASLLSSSLHRPTMLTLPTVIDPSTLGTQRLPAELAGPTPDAAAAMGVRPAIFTPVFPPIEEVVRRQELELRLRAEQLSGECELFERADELGHPGAGRTAPGGPGPEQHFHPQYHQPHLVHQAHALHQQQQHPHQHQHQHFSQQHAAPNHQLANHHPPPHPHLQQSGSGSPPFSGAHPQPPHGFVVQPAHGVLSVAPPLADGGAPAPHAGDAVLVEAQGESTLVAVAPRGATAPADVGAGSGSDPDVLASSDGGEGGDEEAPKDRGAEVCAGPPAQAAGAKRRASVGRTGPFKATSKRAAAGGTASARRRGVCADGASAASDAPPGGAARLARASLEASAHEPSAAPRPESPTWPSDPEERRKARRRETVRRAQARYRAKHAAEKQKAAAEKEATRLALEAARAERATLVARSSLLERLLAYRDECVSVLSFASRTLGRAKRRPAKELFEPGKIPPLEALFTAVRSLPLPEHRNMTPGQRANFDVFSFMLAERDIPDDIEVDDEFAAADVRSLGEHFRLLANEIAGVLPPGERDSWMGVGGGSGAATGMGSVDAWGSSKSQGRWELVEAGDSTGEAQGGRACPADGESRGLVDGTPLASRGRASPSKASSGELPATKSGTSSEGGGSAGSASQLASSVGAPDTGSPPATAAATASGPGSSPSSPAGRARRLEREGESRRGGLPPQAPAPSRAAASGLPADPLASPAERRGTRASVPPATVSPAPPAPPVAQQVSRGRRELFLDPSLSAMLPEGAGGRPEDRPHRANGGPGGRPAHEGSRSVAAPRDASRASSVLSAMEPTSHALAAGKGAGPAGASRGPSSDDASTKTRVTRTGTGGVSPLGDPVTRAEGSPGAAASADPGAPSASCASSPSGGPAAGADADAPPAPSQLPRAMDALALSDLSPSPPPGALDHDLAGAAMTLMVVAGERNPLTAAAMHRHLVDRNGFWDGRPRRAREAHRQLVRLYRTTLERRPDDAMSIFQGPGGDLLAEDDRHWQRVVDGLHLDPTQRAAVLDIADAASAALSGIAWKKRTVLAALLRACDAGSAADVLREAEEAERALRGAAVGADEGDGVVESGVEPGAAAKGEAERNTGKAADVPVAMACGEEAVGAETAAAERTPDGHAPGSCAGQGSDGPSPGAGIGQGSDGPSPGAGIGQVRDRFSPGAGAEQVPAEASPDADVPSVPAARGRSLTRGGASGSESARVGAAANGNGVRAPPLPHDADAPPAGADGDKARSCAPSAAASERDVESAEDEQPYAKDILDTEPSFSKAETPFPPPPFPFPSPLDTSSAAAALRARRAMGLLSAARNAFADERAVWMHVHSSVTNLLSPRQMAALKRLSWPCLLDVGRVVEIIVAEHAKETGAGVGE